MCDQDLLAIEAEMQAEFARGYGMGKAAAEGQAERDRGVTPPWVLALVKATHQAQCYPIVGSPICRATCLAVPEHIRREAGIKAVVHRG